MSKFYIIGKISHELLQRMQKDPAADRSASTKKVIEAAGGKMISYEWVRGRYDVICCVEGDAETVIGCLLYTSPSPRDLSTSRMPSSA